jgi:hypothetical protein
MKYVKSFSKLIDCTIDEANDFLVYAKKLGVTDWSHLYNTIDCYAEDGGTCIDEAYRILLSNRIDQIGVELDLSDDFELVVEGEGFEWGYDFEKKKIFIEYVGDKNDQRFRKVIEKYDDILDALKPLIIKTIKEHEKSDRDDYFDGLEIIKMKIDKFKDKLDKVKNNYKNHLEQLEERIDIYLPPENLEELFLKVNHVRRSQHLIVRIEHILNLLREKTFDNQKEGDSLIECYKKKLEKTKKDYTDCFEELTRIIEKQLTPDDIEDICLKVDQAHRSLHILERMKLSIPSEFIS